MSYHPTSPPLAHRTPQVSYNTSTQPYHTSSASQNTSSLEADYSVSPPPHYTTTRRTYTTTPYTQPTASSQPPYTASQSYHTTTSTSPYNSYSQYYHPHSQNQHTASSPHTSFSQPVTQSSLAQLPENIQKTVGGDKRNRHITTDNDGQDHEKLHPSKHPYALVLSRLMVPKKASDVSPLGTVKGSLLLVGYAYGPYIPMNKSAIYLLCHNQLRLL